MGELSGDVQLVLGQACPHILLRSAEELCRVDVLVEWLCGKPERRVYMYTSSHYWAVNIQCIHIN